MTTLVYLEPTWQYQLAVQKLTLSEDSNGQEYNLCLEQRRTSMSVSGEDSAIWSRALALPGRA